MSLEPQFQEAEIILASVDATKHQRRLRLEKFNMTMRKLQSDLDVLSLLQKVGELVYVALRGYYLLAALLLPL